MRNFIPHEQIPNELQNIDLLVLPLLIEAMSCGVLVICSDSGEIPNVIGNAELIFSENSAVELTEKIKLLMKDKELYKKLLSNNLESYFIKILTFLFFFLKYSYELSRKKGFYGNYFIICLFNLH